MAPDDALARLLAGNRRYVQGTVQNPRRDSVRRVETAQGQEPFAIILTCSDSRLAPEVVFDEGLGDLFTVRIAGNTASDPLVIGSMEFAALNLGCSLLMVLGHNGCGAVQGAVEVVTKGATLPGDISAVTLPIEPAVRAVLREPADRILDAAVERNVQLAVEGLEQIPTFAALVRDEKLKIVGYEYHLEDGTVTAV